MIHGLSRNAKLVISLAVLYLFWGGSYLVTSIGVQSLPPFLMGAVRFTLSGLALFALARAFGEDRPRLDATEWRHLAITGFLTVLVSNGFNVWSLQWLPSNQAALLNVSSAFWITILGTLGRRGHPISALVGAGLAIGAAGVALILWPAGGEVAAPGAGEGPGRAGPGPLGPGEQQEERRAEAEPQQGQLPALQQHLAGLRAAAGRHLNELLRASSRSAHCFTAAGAQI